MANHTLELLVREPAEKVLDSAFAFIRDGAFPANGTVYRRGDAVSFVKENRDMLGSRWGVVALIFLGLVTGGVFLVLWLPWRLVAEAGPERASVTAFPAGDHTKVLISAEGKGWRKTLEKWAKKELQPV
jgi:hypothetical protein